VAKVKELTGGLGAHSVIEAVGTLWGARSLPGL
jgi:threonine dehydrogenase-like Zn-dependent dehydrogenase